MDPAQGIVDQPVTSDEMAAIDQAASQYGAVVQPTSAMPSNNDQPQANVPGIVQPQTPSEPPADETPAPITDDAAFAEPSTETQAEAPAPTPEVAEAAPVETEVAPLTEAPGVQEQTEAAPEITPSLSPVPASEFGQGTDEELLGVKQQALEELTPIVDTLDLPAEERFDTLMMIIRASDDKKLIKPAYDAANQIADKDKKARALLDVVNEVNYLTQNQPDQT